MEIPTKRERRKEIKEKTYLYLIEMKVCVGRYQEKGKKFQKENRKK